MFYFRLKMSEVDDEVYSTIFSALRHGVRRRILRMLSEGHMSFTSLYETLGVSSSHLTYHLDSLGELVSKNDSKYKLSVFGRAAYDMMNNVENPPTNVDLIRGQSLYKVVSAVLLIALLTMSGLYYNLYDLNRSQKDMLAQKDAEIEVLMASMEGIAGLPELKNILKGDATIKIASQQILRYWYEQDFYQLPLTKDKVGIYPLEEAIQVFYAPLDNLTLRVTLYLSDFPSDFYLPVTLQKGNALLNESGAITMIIEHDNRTWKWWSSPVIWSENLTQGKQIRNVELPSKGWYTLSLTGPVEVDSSGEPDVKMMWGEREDWFDILSLNVNGYSTLVAKGTPIFFIIETSTPYSTSGWILDEFLGYYTSDN